MLANYREYAGRCMYLEFMIAKKEAELRSLQQTLIEDSVSCTQVISDMPRGGALSDPTARLGAAVADGYESDQIKQVKAEIEALQNELDAKQPTILFVSALLEGLSEKERWIVEKQVIDGAYWREVIFGYRTKFGDTYSKDGLKRIKKAALQKLYRIAS